jgi:murein DD-endopeptidase MepM/ murein hydrolase activator NlpD
MTSPQSYARFIQQGLKPLGLNDVQIAGVIGNFKGEGGADLNPTRNEGGALGLPGKGPGYGWAQWTGPRLDALVKSAGGAAQAGTPQAQLNFLRHELQTTEKGALAALKGARTPAEAALIFQDKFERPGIPTPGRRAAYADTAYQWITGGQASPVAAGGAASGLQGMAGDAGPEPQRMAGDALFAAFPMPRTSGSAQASGVQGAAFTPSVGSRDAAMAMAQLAGLGLNPIASLFGLPGGPAPVAPAQATAAQSTGSPAPLPPTAQPAGGSAPRWEKPSSVVYENKSGQPGVDLFFESKQFPAVLGGRVKEVRREPGYGNFVVVESPHPGGGAPVDTLYSHLADGGVSVRAGDMVAPGQIIGKQGGTGNVRSADGTIASIDFLQAAPAGSGSMTPHQDYEKLRRFAVRRMGAS